MAELNASCEMHGAHRRSFLRTVFIRRSKPHALDEGAQWVHPIFVQGLQSLGIGSDLRTTSFARDAAGVSVEEVTSLFAMYLIPSFTYFSW